MKNHHMKKWKNKSYIGKFKIWWIEFVQLKNNNKKIILISGNIILINNDNNIINYKFL